MDRNREDRDTYIERDKEREKDRNVNNNVNKKYNNNSNSNSNGKYSDNKRNHYKPYSRDSHNENNKNQKIDKEQCKMYNLPTIITSQKESDPVKLKTRQKDIDFGKNTIGYDNYIAQIPRHKREKQHPRTPDKYQRCSRRSWAGQIKKWRKELHKFDPNATEEDDDDNYISDTINNKNDNDEDNKEDQQQQQQVNNDKDQAHQTDDTDDLEANQLLLSSLLSTTTTTTTTTSTT
ncbi:histone RNA hairpin-binding protein [Heterostelium album PN500]|uniref:Histone RNA hairpin-binding protein n=1 Tax=Heterostelium pallidum (strain ATCC 26659 / Pp 5 / PN500) TaxID=670386 RepID=D3BIV3_HETP5|nr:histone RNA hairpin-binding protein [Heterostelium album PN500]EFA78727.1 histone RNA hairpin-binding protein [Heterostelium album PN500]|eukprot:XP_020430851.1 histone RNA hairpin-binding protein [Heterostelium album PN500]